MLIESVAVAGAGTAGETLFAGGRAGLFRSTNRGETWDQILDAHHVRAIAIAGGLQRDDDFTTLVGTEEDGILRSDDGGSSWVSSNAGLLDLSILVLATHRESEDGRLVLAGTASGLYLSRNFGKAWRPVLVEDEHAIQCLAMLQSREGTPVAFAGTEAHGLLRSNDGGIGWQRVEEFRGRDVSAIAVAPPVGPDRTIAVGCGEGIFLSSDSGETWNSIGAVPGDVMSLLFIHCRPDSVCLLAGLHTGGVVRFDPDNQCWVPSDSGLQANVATSLTFVPALQANGYFLLQSLECGAALSADCGSSWSRIDSELPVSAPQVFAGAIDSAGRPIVYAPSDDGLTRFDPGSFQAQTVLNERIISCDSRDSLVAAVNSSGRIWFSSDHGGSWQIREGPNAPGMVAELRARVMSGNQLHVFVLSSDLEAPSHWYVWELAGLDRSWKLVTNNPEARPVAFVVGSWVHDNDLIVLAFQDRIVLYRRRTPTSQRQSQSSWERQEIFLDGGVRITSVAVSNGHGLLLGTDRGVHRLDRHSNFLRSWDDGLAGLPIVDLVVVGMPDGLTAFALGLGGSVWRRVIPAE